MKIISECGVLSAGELALVLNISEWTVTALAKAGQLPCEYEKRRPLFRLENVINHFKVMEGA
jgi:hypothetical protein